MTSSFAASRTASVASVVLLALQKRRGAPHDGISVLRLLHDGRSLDRAAAMAITTSVSRRAGYATFVSRTSRRMQGECALRRALHEG